MPTRFFEEHYWNRMTMRAVLARLGREMAMAPVSVDREHLRVLVSASDAAVHPGNRFTLFVDVIPSLECTSAGRRSAADTRGWPCRSSRFRISPSCSALSSGVRVEPAWTDEALTGYKGPVRVAIDVSLGTRQEMAAVRDAGRGGAIGGTVRLQACDDRICWAPEPFR